MRKLTALVAATALALAAPAASFANHGGPHSSKPCPTTAKAQGHGPKKPAKNMHGKKCGFQKLPG
jgi:hypothetical protein